jgi:hypothetical protein
VFHHDHRISHLSNLAFRDSSPGFILAASAVSETG